MRAIVLLLSAAPAFAAGLRVDHATVCGTSVQQLQSAMKAAGIDSVYGGPHANRASEMALVSFPDGSYLELMGIQKSADPTAVAAHEWAKFLNGNAGPCAWALRVSKLPAEVARLKAAGVMVTGPDRSGRQRPDGVKLEWQTSKVGPETRGTFFPFLIEDLTPRNQRVYPQGKPVTREFRGVSRVVIAVRNLDDAIARYRQAFGLRAPHREQDTALEAEVAVFGNSPVVLAAPMGSHSWLAQRLEQFGEAPCAFVLRAARRKSRPGARSRWNRANITWIDAGFRLGIEDPRKHTNSSQLHTSKAGTR